MFAPALLHWPSGQTAQPTFVDPVEYEPASHGAQVLVDVFAYVPAPQLEQEEEPEDADMVPGLQVVHLARASWLATTVPASLRNVPAGQERQAAVPPVE